MKLLVITQAVDNDDPILGFFTRWIEELAVRNEFVHVICLTEGEHSLPENVRVHSLGKETRVGKFKYITRFYTYLWKLRSEYNSVFVHMNEEYVLMGGLAWQLFGKRIFLWRNHAKGTWRTLLAVLFCTKVFCTSKHSFTAGFKKTILMPVGIDLSRFKDDGTTTRKLRSILFLSRISPVKRPEMFIDALGEALSRGASFTASVYGSPLPHDEPYYESLKARAESLGLHDRIHFYGSIPNYQTPTVYLTHDIFVNCTPSGAFDKTLFEAAACGCRVIASSDDFRDAAGEDAFAPDTTTLAERLIHMLSEDEDTVEQSRIQMQALARSESLGTLMDRLLIECLK